MSLLLHGNDTITVTITKVRYGHHTKVNMKYGQIYNYRMAIIVGFFVTPCFQQQLIRKNEKKKKKMYVFGNMLKIMKDYKIIINL